MKLSLAYEMASFQLHELNSFALRMANSFGLSECNRVKKVLASLEDKTFLKHGVYSQKKEFAPQGANSFF